ncbi:hypothetical protein YpMG051020_2484 [Yersinia pestis biovar Orientalis str. MG05-1020]|nr:hypothetical protein YpE1979001_1145 [Yersinia pestis biovar Antiqua str. E1979001]EDR59063.1 hypothetical protein YpMG051020_2484 [Yersinia pestis biovar Orientalis str. MG05-1020]
MQLAEDREVVHRQSFSFQSVAGQLIITGQLIIAGQNAAKLL